MAHIDDCIPQPTAAKNLKIIVHIGFALTGVVTTLDDPQGRRTVAEFVPDDVRVYPVGRLDYDTSGLLLLTNDGELTNQLTNLNDLIGI